MREDTNYTRPMQWEKVTAPVSATAMHALRSTCVTGMMSPYPIVVTDTVAQ